MIDRALAGMFKVITDEAAANPAFGKKIEDTLAKFGQELAEKRMAERNIDGFHPLVEYKRDMAGFEARLAKFDVKELRAIIDRHHLDPANAIRGKGTKKSLAAFIRDVARKRAERDARLFEY